jgi:hypothetical protein
MNFDLAMRSLVGQEERNWLIRFILHLVNSHKTLCEKMMYLCFHFRNIIWSQCRRWNEIRDNGK